MSPTRKRRSAAKQTAITADAPTPVSEVAAPLIPEDAQAQRDNERKERRALTEDADRG